MKLKIFVAVVSIIIIISLLIIVNNDKLNTSLACAKLEEFKNEEYDELVLRKYIDEENHQFRTIELNNKKTLVLARDTSGFYNFIQQNDSIVKRKGTDILMVYRLNTVHRFKIYYGCSN